MATTSIQVDDKALAAAADSLGMALVPKSDVEDLRRLRNAEQRREIARQLRDAKRALETDELAEYTQLTRDDIARGDLFA
ncbi:hypothetical protein GCM10009555_074690 [Acrocarpospora macrocephala]|uniref:Uncharacterized protein n=1 Tax=Acrocarpospora macrocephala TaxID=150177 RepID=A0A5M3WT26_9ACTN|nr:hypothetical protein [Acrocarpospora macrocephala]GES11372.1 hypothetical protein Amac_049690 [Acrocarpospora macrocephala]